MGDNDASSSNAAAAGNDAAAEVGAAVGKVEASRDGTPSSMESTPEQEAGAENANEPAQPQKRKGGRKPIYATSEERKQRNRQAQAAFRERRTEYIKQLEATIKQNEETLSTLQQSHRSAADECLMLRYKNSLLERILLEKGIDVQAELSMKTGSPTFPPGFMQHIPIQPTQPPLQRTAVQRHHARRSGQAITPKLQPGQSQPEMTFHNTSPQAVPTPSSHVSSPNTVSTRSPVAMHQGGMTPPTSAVLAQTQAQQFQGFSRSQQPPLNTQFYQPAQQQTQQFHRAQRPAPPQQYHSNTSGISSQSPSSQSGGHNGPPGSSGSGGGSNSTSVVPSASAYYPSPFQKHIDQLEQEYDTQHASHSMLDQPEPGDDDDDPSDPDTHLETGHGNPHGLQGAYPPQQMQYEPQPPQPQQQPPPGYAPYQQHASAMPPPGQQQMSPQYDHPQQMQQGHPQQQGGEHEGPAYGSLPGMIDPNDPMLDADPFGLSASMHYPTSYSFDQHQQGR